MSFDKVGYDNEYQKQNYDRISVFVPKGKRDELKDLAAEKRVSVNELIITAIEEYYHIFIK